MEHFFMDFYKEKSTIVHEVESRQLVEYNTDYRSGKSQITKLMFKKMTCMITFVRSYHP